MKKLLTFLLINSFLTMPAIAKADKTSAEYLKNKKHFAIMNPLAEKIAENAIKKTLKKKIGEGNYKVLFEIYTIESLKKGIFKNLEITGKDLIIEEIPVPYLNLKNITDYHWIDLESDPVKLKSDVTFAYNLELSEKSINTALKQKDYEKTLKKVNNIAYPLFTLHDVRVKIKHNKLHIIMDFSLPLSSSSKKRSFMVSSNFKVDNGKIKTSNIGFDNSYGNLPIDKVTNLINLVNPLTFTLAQINDDNCKGKIENVKIEDNIVKINGKIFVEGVSEKNKGE